MAAAGKETPDAGLAPARISFGTTRTGPASKASAAAAPQVRRAVSTAAVRLGSRLTGRRSLDRGNGGLADSWTSQPGRPATRDFHHPDGSRPQQPAQPA